MAHFRLPVANRLMAPIFIIGRISFVLVFCLVVAGPGDSDERFSGPAVAFLEASPEYVPDFGFRVSCGGRFAPLGERGGQAKGRWESTQPFESMSLLSV